MTAEKGETADAAPPSRAAGSPPAFVLTLPRSGSTLLRFLLDSHSAVACPPESQLAPLCGNLLSSWMEYKGDSDAQARRRLGLAQARAASRRLIAWHLARSDKALFCDKSLPNVDLAPLLADIFPRAWFVCLYRNPMDFIASALDAGRYGFSAYGMHPYAVSSVDNPVFGMGRMWCEKTAMMLSFERQLPRRSLRVRYEDLVREARSTWERVCAFLRVPFEPDVLARALMEPHLLGPGDHKIRTTRGISTDSLGSGSAVPVGLLPPLGLRSMNELAGELGYPEVDLTWNRQPSPFREGLVDAEEQEAASGFLAEALGRRLPELQAAASGPVRLRVLVEEFGEPRGLEVDGALGVRPCEGRRPAEPEGSGAARTVVSRLDSLMALCYGASSVTQLVDRGEIRPGGPEEDRGAVDGVRALDALLFGVAHESPPEAPSGETAPLPAAEGSVTPHR